MNEKAKGWFANKITEKEVGSRHLLNHTVEALKRICWILKRLYCHEFTHPATRRKWEEAEILMKPDAIPIRWKRREAHIRLFDGAIAKGQF